jgi:heme/copper-type cytochrome/quinol oxidase subunit 3
LNHAATAPAPHQEPETTTGLDTWKLGFWIFIGSETLFFGSLITTYMVYADAAVVGPHPHEILDIPLTTISTFVLLMSSLLMVLALHAIQQGNRRGTLTWLMATVVFGAIFLGFQAYEFTHFVHEGLTLQQNIFGASFYVLTGFHGLHVSVGLIWLLVLWGLVLRGELGQKDALKVEIAGLYWHFVDVVWIAIFTLIYLMSGAH